MRLREETEFRPKPLVQVGERPILWHIMKHYAAFGQKHFVLCLGYRGDQIKHYFLNYFVTHQALTVRLTNPPQVDLHGEPEERDWRITLADTGHAAQTGARLKKIEPYIQEEDFFLTYGDGVSDVSISELLTFHQSHGKIATVTGVRPPARFGELLSEGNQVRQFREKPLAQEGRISGGFMVLNRRVFDYLDERDSCSFEHGPLAQLADDGQLMVHHHDGFWQCMDTYRDLQLLNQMWDSQERPWVTW